MAERFTIIRNGLLVDGPAHATRACDILVKGDVIAAVGPPGLPAPPDAIVIDATSRLMLPGLVNGHTHSHANLPRSPGDKWTLELALHLNPALRGNQTVEDKYISALLGAAEMISKGCTACYDLFYEFPGPSSEGLNAVAQAYADAGMRAVVAPMVASHSFYRAIPGLLEAIPEEHRETLAPARKADRDVLAEVRTALHHWKFDRNSVRMAIAPTIPLHCSDDDWKAAARVAQDYGVGLHTHLAESKVQALAGLERYGRTLTSHLYSLGVLGPRFTAAHGVWLDDDDLSMLSDCGSCVVHNPASNMRYGSGMAAVRRMTECRVCVGLGTDSRTCSDNLNMFEAMRLASFTSRVRGPDYTRWLATEEVLAMATEGSARALGFDGALGRIAPGYKADIVFLDRWNLNYVPLNDVTNQIVNAEDATAVKSVMIGGKLVYHDGGFITIDIARLVAQAETSMERLRGANASARRLTAALEPVVGSFCSAMASRAYHVERFVDDTERRGVTSRISS